MVTRVQILTEAVCISHSANTSGERYESNYSLSTYVQIVGQIELFNFDMATCLKENSELKPVKLSLKSDLVLHPARLGIYIYIGPYQVSPTAQISLTLYLSPSVPIIHNSW